MVSPELARKNRGSGARRPAKVACTSCHSVSKRSCGKCQPTLLNTTSICTAAALYIRLAAPGSPGGGGGDARSTQSSFPLVPHEGLAYGAPGTLGPPLRTYLRGRPSGVTLSRVHVLWTVIAN